MSHLQIVNGVAGRPLELVMSRLQLLMVCVVVGGAFGCGQLPGATVDAVTGGGVAGGSAAGGNAGGSAALDGNLAGLPCDIANVMRTRCVSCHNSPPTAGAPMPLTSYANLMAPSPLGGTYASRSLTRMRDPIASMPPAGLPVSELATYEAWMNAGAPMGSCGTVAGDGGMVMLTCQSNRTWPNRYQGSGDMNPGMACRACHAGENFKGQNPQGESELARQYFFAGTLFPGLHEKDGCLDASPAGVTVEILDGAGAVKFSMTPRAGSGNFYNSTIRTTPTWLPYTARVKRNGVVVSTMRTPQMSGDCNLCHTERGEMGAPGRITTGP
jgi:hypothetical protein